MKTSSTVALALALGLAALAFAQSCKTGPEAAPAEAAGGPADAAGSAALAVGSEGPQLGTLAHEQEVQKSSYCATCHADIAAEHAQNTHGRAFTDEEVRLATGRFSQADCIICHTPRPVFESGIGQNPIRRHFDLEEGNTCMTCHWREGQDYSRFRGGPDCKTAFDPRVGTVEACASCHRNHGTPFQWEQAKNGKLAGNVCMDCHMPTVVRPVATGEAPREVKSHLFPASRSLSQLRRAYAYDARIDGNEVVVHIENKGAGHNFPTELKQRSIESLVVVRDAQGKEVARSRMTFRDPYKRPYGLTLPVNTQIPSGESREHRVPITVPGGTVECELHYKLYYPIEDYHPELARRLESRTLAFSGVDPSTKPVESEPEVRIVTPEGITPETAGPANLVDFAHPPIGKVDVEIPKGDSADDIRRLIELFQFPVLQANIEARKRLTEIGLPAVPALIEGMGSWDNKTWNQSMAVLESIGAPAAPALLAALESQVLYVRLHAAELVGRTGLRGENGEAARALQASLARPNALDRSHAAAALGDLKLAEASPKLRALVAEDRDPDVVRAAARALASIGDKESVPTIRAALDRFAWDETRRDLAEALARLGDPSGIPILIAGLDIQDDLVRESCFESLFAVTGKHFCYEALAPREERLEAMARLSGWWAKEGGADALHPHKPADAKTRAEVRKAIDTIAGSDGSMPPGDDEKLRARLIEIGPPAVPLLAFYGLKYAPGFWEKRAALCGILGEIGDAYALPGLIAALRDPVIGVAAWACDALGRIGDPTALPAVQRYYNRVLSLAAAGRIPASAGAPDRLLALAASACLKLGDSRVEPDLAGLLLSDDESARIIAAAALSAKYGAEFQYDPAASLDERRAAVERWQTRPR